MRLDVRKTKNLNSDLGVNFYLGAPTTLGACFFVGRNGFREVVCGSASAVDLDFPLDFERMRL